MAQFTWFGGTGDLGNPYNWTNQPDPNNPVTPGPEDDVDISGTGTLTGTDTVSYAELSGNIDLEGTLAATDSAGGDGIADVSGSVVVQNGGALTATVHLTVGYYGAGALTVENGGAATSPYLNVGGLAGSDGNMTVRDGGSLTLTVFGVSVGWSGSGTLTAEDQGEVTTTGLDAGVLAGSTGNVTISTGAVLTDSLGLGVGDAGTGTVNVKDQATAVTAANMEVGNQAGGDGTVTISTGASLTVSGGLAVGVAGRGTMNVEDQATTVTAATMEVGSQAGGDGTVTISTGASLTVSGDLAVGVTGIGSVDVEDQATLTAATMEVGSQAGGDGIVTISTGAKLTVTGAVTGAGQLDIDPGGTLELGSSDTLNVSYLHPSGNIGVNTLKLDQASSFTDGSLGHGRWRHHRSCRDYFITLELAIDTVQNLTGDGDSTVTWPGLETIQSTFQRQRRQHNSWRLRRRCYLFDRHGDQFNPRWFRWHVCDNTWFGV